MKLLDLFCGAGGAAMGYHRVGFDVVGVDINRQPRYPFSFLQADALALLDDTEFLQQFDVIHASPPCQAYSIAQNNNRVKPTLALVDDVRALLKRTGKPYVIENVIGAPLMMPAILCGAAFGLKSGIFDLARHRAFESNILLFSTACVHRRGFTIGVYGGGTNGWHRRKFGRCVRGKEKAEAMGIDWMTGKELTQAIPPAYTEYIGQQLLNALKGSYEQKLDYL